MQVSSSRGTFYMNVCGGVSGDRAPTTGCGGAAVCLVSAGAGAMSFGTPAMQQYIMEGDVLKVSYTDGKACGRSGLLTN